MIEFSFFFVGLILLIYLVGQSSVIHFNDRNKINGYREQVLLLGSDCIRS